MAIFFPRTAELTRGLRFRLSLVYSALFGICLILLALFVTGEYLELAREEQDQALRNFALDLSNHVEPGGGQLDVRVADQIKFFPFVIQETSVVVRNLDGRVLFQSRQGVTPPYQGDLARRPRYTHRFLDFHAGGESWRGVNLKFRIGKDAFYIMQVANTMGTLKRQQDRHFLFLLIIIPLTILISALFSTRLAGKALEPIRLTVRRMEELLKSGDYAPLPVPPTGDEIEELTRTFNTMLTQLQTTMAAQEQFVSHASHQLNTPLTIMRGELEVLMGKERTPEEVQRYHESLRQELVRLSQLVQDMLMVSRVEAGKAHFRFTALRLDELVGETLERLAPHARQKDVRLRYDIDAALVDDEALLEVLGERQLLSVLFENLVENAVKYSPLKGHVTVRLVGGAERGLRAEVIDEGPGMDPQLMGSAARPQRFARGERQGDVQGSGLGLYLAARIAEHHGLTLSVTPNSPRGTVFGVAFPPRQPTRGA